MLPYILLLTAVEGQYMSNLIPGNQKHLTLDNRITIEKGLDADESLRQIASQIGKDPSTVSKEIQKHRTEHPHNKFNESRNKCSQAASCKKKHICQRYAPVCKRQ